MSDENGGLLTVNAVHYDTSLAEARKHFEDQGFRGIESITKSKPINCNEARTEVSDTAKAGGPDWWWQGAWDYSAGTCAIYTIVCAVMSPNRG